MSNNLYIGYDFQVIPLQPGTEILMAQLGYAGFESFVETELGFTAYIQKSDWNNQILEDVQLINSKEFEISYQFKEIDQVNWNAEWERNFTPIVVSNKVTVRAPFHEVPKTDFDIIIEPKMSFGTGHHETTHMMIEFIIQNDFQYKSVLDMGCGTGVLAILSEMKGATSLDAIDIDNWCYINSLENVERNNCNNIEVFEGDSQLLKNKHYDIVIANINRNILLNDLDQYVSCLNPKGMLFLSGFYKEDSAIIEKACNNLGLFLVESKEKNHWVALKFIK